MTQYFKDFVYISNFRNSKFINDISEIIEANRAGIYVENLVFEPEIDHNCEGNGSVGIVKRFLYFTPPKNGVVMFFINRHVIEKSYVNIVISPDHNLIHGNVYMRHTSTTFFAKSHYVIALTLDEDRAIVYDDTKKKSFVCICLFLMCSFIP